MKRHRTIEGFRNVRQLKFAHGGECERFPRYEEPLRQHRPGEQPQGNPGATRNTFGMPWTRLDLAKFISGVTTQKSLVASLFHYIYVYMIQICLCPVPSIH